MIFHTVASFGAVGRWYTNCVARMYSARPPLVAVLLLATLFVANPLFAAQEADVRFDFVRGGRVIWAGSGNVSNGVWTVRVKQGDRHAFRVEAGNAGKSYNGTLTVESNDYPFWVRCDFDDDIIDFPSSTTQGCQAVGNDWFRYTPTDQFAVAGGEVITAWTLPASVGITASRLYITYLEKTKRSSAPDCGNYQNTSSHSTYYVRQSGSDSRNGRTAQSAFGTIAKAIAVVKPGDTVYVGAGVYREELRQPRDGAAGKPIRFVADVSGSQTGDSGPVLINGGWVLEGAAWVEISGFRITGAKNFFYWKNCSYGTITGCEIFGGNNGLQLIDCHHMHISNCDIHHTGDDGMDIGDCKAVLIEECRLYLCGEDGIDLETNAELAIIHCDIANNNSNGITNSITSAKGTFVPRVYVLRCSIRNNRRYGVNDKGLNFNLCHSLIFANGKDGIRSTGSAFIWSSTIADNAESGVLADGSPVRLFNSIVAINTDYGIYGNVQSDYNVAHGNRLGDFRNRVRGSNDKSQDPRFVNAGLHDYRLRPGSPAIDASKLFTIYHGDPEISQNLKLDVAGQLRPRSHEQWDVGAYESNTGPSEYFVRVNGNDNNDGMSRRTAFGTIGKAVEVASPGDTIHVGGGVYAQATAITKSGSKEAPITIRADESGAKTGDPGVVRIVPPKANRFAWTISQASHLKIIGFVFDGEGIPRSSSKHIQAVQIISSGSLEFNDCVFQACDDPLHASYSSVKFDNCRFLKNLAEALTVAHGELHAIGCQFLDNNTGPYSEENYKCLIESSTIRGCAGPALNIAWGTNGDPASAEPIIRDCQILKNGAGISLRNARDNSKIRFVRATITKTSGTEILLADSELTIDSQWRKMIDVEQGTSGIYAVNSNLSIVGLTFDNYDGGQAFGVCISGGVAKINECRFNNCFRGLRLNSVERAAVRNCEFVDCGNKSSGVGCALNILNPQIDLVIIAGTTIRDSFIGLELLGVENGDLRISNSPLRNNSFGLFAQNCSLTFDNDNVGKKWRLEDNATGIIAYGGDITFDNATISGSRGWGVVLSGAKVLAKDSQFRNNGSGLYVKKAPDARFINCSFVDNSGTNLGINNAQLVNSRWEATAGTTVLRDCTIARGGYGIWCDHTWIGESGPEWKVFNTTICNNDLGIYSTNGNVEFTGEQGWEFRDNKHHIYAVRGACSLDGVTLSGASVEALTAVGTDLVVKNSELARSGVGLVAWACPSFVARNSRFVKNTMFGAKIRGAATFRGCEIRENGDFSAGDGGGLLLYATNEADHDLRGTRIEDNYVGVRVQACDWRLTPDNIARWTFPENEFASLQAYDAKLIAKGVEFAGNHCYALSSMSSDVELVNCNFHDNDGGAISWADRSFSATNCKFTDSSGPGMTVGYGPVAIRKCRFERNGRQGLLAHYNSRVDLEDSRFTGNGDFGVFLKINQPTATWDDKNLHRVVDCEIDKNQYGLRVVHAEDHNFELKNTSISGSAWYSIMYDTCSLTVSDQKKNEWTVTGNTCGPCVRYGDVTLDSVNSENNWNIGFLVEQGGRATLRNCRSTGAKYGLYQNNSTQTILDSCRFEGQYTNNWKWAVYVEGGPLTAINSVFAGFHQGFWSGHLRGPSDAKRLFLNNTVADLRYMGNGVQASACHTTVHNNIFASNRGATALRREGGTLRHSHNLCHGFGQIGFNTKVDESTIDRDPLFANAATGNYRLAKGSPAINSGLNLPGDVPVDMEGNPRPSFHVSEIGAYEFTRANGSLRLLEWREVK